MPNTNSKTNDAMVEAVIEAVESSPVESAVSMTSAQVAEAIGTDAKTLRRFMRSTIKAQGGTVGVETPGSGGRYAFTSSNLDTIKRRFASWNGGGKTRLVILTDDESAETEAPDAK